MFFLKTIKTVSFPDVLIVCDKEKYRGNDIILGLPDFVAEVLSPSTEKYDRIVKLNKNKASLKTYSFEEGIPLGISGEITIDFNAIYTRLKTFFEE